MKILIIGLGSMGKRRIRNLRLLKINDIYGYDVDLQGVLKAKKKYKIKTLESLNKIASFNFDVVLICTPPQHHLQYVKICVKNSLPFFTELNLLTAHVKNIATLTHKSKVAGYPSNTEFYDQDIKVLTRLIGKNFKGYFLFHLGQNIHDWHPWQKSGQHFIFSSATNGLREMLRVELPWLIKIFGDIVSVKGATKAFFTKSYGVNDFICVILKFKNGNQGILIFDLISPVVIKELSVISVNRKIVWNELGGKITVNTANKRRLINLPKGSIYPGYKFREDNFILEIKQLLSDVKKHKLSEYTYVEELNLLKIIDKIEQNLR